MNQQHRNTENSQVVGDYYEGFIWTDGLDDPLEPLCAGCHDEIVEHEGDICPICRASAESDWVDPAEYHRMRLLAGLETNHAQ